LFATETCTAQRPGVSGISSSKQDLLFTTAAILIASAAVPVESFASDHVLAVRIAPPAPRHQVVPAARHGYEWAPGFWNWNGRKFVWTNGHWERSRRGQAFQPAKWEQDGGTWRLNRGEWVRADRDRDHDGVPNRNDNHPDNPMRR
jgi:hypothetical protein